MSIWSHVNCSIRVDGIGIPKLDPSLYDNSEWYDTPRGSEGPLRVQTTLVGSGMVYYDIQITGDLRDYEDPKPIIEWLKKVTKDLMIRSGIIEIETEGMGKWVYIYCHEKEKWKKIYTLEE